MEAECIERTRVGADMHALFFKLTEKDVGLVSCSPCNTKNCNSSTNFQHIFIEFFKFMLTCNL